MIELELRSQHRHGAERAGDLLRGHGEAEVLREADRQVAHRCRSAPPERDAEDIVDVAGFVTKHRVTARQAARATILKPPQCRLRGGPRINRVPQWLAEGLTLRAETRVSVAEPPDEPQEEVGELLKAGHHTRITKLRPCVKKALAAPLFPVHPQL